MEKYRFASSLFPSPKVAETIALPPVASINPTVLTPMIIGIIKFIAAKEVLPTKLETKNPSTTLYIDVKIIIITDGNTYLKSFLYVKWSPS